MNAAAGRPSSLSRRRFLPVLAAGVAAGSEGLEIPGELKTPHKIGRLVLKSSGKNGAFDSESVDVPFVFRDGKRFLMTFVGFDGTGYQTGLASSDNLIDWKPEGVILARDPKSPVISSNAALTWILRENDVFSEGSLRKVGGVCLGTYHAYPRPGYEEGPAVIGLCRSRDLVKWEIEPPCLRAQDGAAWERGGLYKSCLLEHEGAYYLFYNAKTEARRWTEQTGFATSRDLKTWTRFAANPVLPNGGPGSVDEVFSSDPCVLRYRDRWAVFYYSLDRKGVARDLLAISPDLRTFRKCDGVLIDVGPPGSVDSQYAHKPSVIWHDGVLFHFYCAVSKEHGRGISFAASRKVW
jgi:predicted GH43/DUF377 family glycosyl hydrolase